MAAFTDPTAEHFNPAEFDEMIGSHGTPALWRRARRCPCVTQSTGQARPGCPVCLDGTIYDEGTETRVLAFQRDRKTEYDVAGVRIEGMITLTFATDIIPGHFDLIDLPAAVMVVDNELHVRGLQDAAGRSTERLRLNPVEIQFVDAILGGVLTTYEFFTHFTVADDGTINWTAGPPDGTQYTVRYTARPRYIVWEPMSRDENAVRMPYKARAQRYDFFQPRSVGEG